VKKIERNNFFGSFLETLKTAFTYILVFAGIMDLQVLLTLAIRPMYALEELHKIADFGKEVTKVIGEQLWVLGIVFGFGFGFWIWTTCS